MMDALAYRPLLSRSPLYCILNSALNSPPLAYVGNVSKYQAQRMAFGSNLGLP